MKRIFNANLGDISGELRETVMGLGKRDRDELRRTIETQIAERLSKSLGIEIDPNYVILHAFDIKSVRETSRNDEAGIFVAATPAPRPFDEESPLFRSINEGYVARFVEVYAPVEWDTQADKNRLRREWREGVSEVIETCCRKANQGANP